MEQSSIENDYVELKKRNATEQHCRAAQMFAEMLSMVCHREYYSQGDQKICFPSDDF